MSDDKPKTQFWKNCGIFMSGTVVGIGLALGGIVAWKQVQLSRGDIQIKLPAANSTPANMRVKTPSVATARPPSIPQAPAQLSTPATTAIAPTPVAAPSPSKAPQLPSGTPTKPSPSPSFVATQRVNFDAGSTGSTVRDSLKANQSKRYTLECNGGQEMTVEIEEGVVSVAIIDPSGEKLGSAMGTIKWQGKLPSSGDYTLEVSALSQSSYAVKVDVL